MLLERLGEIAIARIELVEKAHILDRDHGLVGEGLQQCNLRCGKRAGLGSSDCNPADDITLAQQRHGEHAAESARCRRARDHVIGVGENIFDHAHRSRRNRTRHGGIAAGWPWEETSQALDVVRVHVDECGEVDKRPVVGEHVGEVGIAKLRDRSGNRVEHRLHVGLRPADDAQDVAGRGLLLERLREVAVAGAELVEEADVLNRDDRLIGKRLQQRDLRIGEGAGIRLADGDGPKRLTVAHEGNGERRAKRRAQREFLHFVIRIGDHVRDGDEPAFEDCPRRRAPAADGHGENLSHGRGAFLGEVGGRDERHVLAFDARDEDGGRAAQHERRRRDRVEHRLHVRLRAADDLQDVGRGGLLLERFGEVAVARLELGEQAHVLDGDDRLVGERLQERDLRVGKFSRDVAIHGDRADRLAVANHRHREHAAKSSRCRDVVVAIFADRGGCPACEPSRP